MTHRSTALTLSVGSILALGLLPPAVPRTTSKEAAAKTETTDTAELQGK